MRLVIVTHSVCVCVLCWSIFLCMHRGLEEHIQYPALSLSAILLCDRGYSSMNLELSCQPRNLSVWSPVCGLFYNHLKWSHREMDVHNFFIQSIKKKGMILSSNSIDLQIVSYNLHVVLIEYGYFLNYGCFATKKQQYTLMVDTLSVSYTFSNTLCILPHNFENKNIWFLNWTFYMWDIDKNKEMILYFQMKLFYLFNKIKVGFL